MPPVLAPLFVIFGAVLILAGYAIGFPDDLEDFYATSLTTRLFWQSLLHGENPFWTDFLGLGLPQPFRISIVQHPLGWLFAVTSPVTAAKLLVVGQGALACALMYMICIRIRMPRLFAVMSSLTWALSTSFVEYVYVDDFFSTFLSVTFFPATTYLLVRHFQDSGRASLGFLLGAGVSVGLLLATGLASHALSMCLVLAAFILGPRILQMRSWLTVTTVFAIAAVIGAGMLAMVANEFVQFTAAASRIQHPNPSVLAHVQQALGFDLWAAIMGPNDFYHSVVTNSHRTIGFGPVAAIAALVGLVVPLGPLAARIKLAFIASLALMMLPGSFYLNIVTATWVFRDGTNFFGAILFGLLLSALANHLGRWRAAITSLAVMNVLVLATLIVPLWLNTFANGTSHPRGPDNHARFVGKNIFFDRLRAIIGPSESRILFAPQLDAEIRRLRLYPYGAVANVGALYGFRTVNTFARGIATGPLAPEFAVMEGLIAAQPENVRDISFLTSLGIGYVISLQGEEIAPQLERVGEIILPDRVPIIVWRNPRPFAPVTELSTRALELELPLLPGCGHDRFFCRDFHGLVDLRLGDPAGGITRGAGDIAFTLSPTTETRLLVINSWYRPGWTSNDPRIRVLPVFGQLLGVLVEAGVDRVALSYRPRVVFAAYLVSTIALIGFSLLAVVLVRGGGRSRGGVEATA